MENRGERGMNVRQSNKKLRIVDMTFMRDLHFISGDWKDQEDIFKQFIKFLRNQGYHIYEDPVCKGSDSYGWIISQDNLTRKQLTILKNRYEI